MSCLKKKLIQDLSDSVVEMDENKTEKVAKEYIKNNFNAYEAINDGLTDGMERVGELYEVGEYYIPELLICSDVMYLGLDILKPYLKKEDNKEKIKVVIGVVEGDAHDLGKNIVKTMLETSGFQVFDLGRDVPPINFVKKAKEIDADIIALSTLMTTTMGGIKEVIEILEKDNLKDKFKVIVGGGPISSGFAKKIGADGYSPNASKAVKLVKTLV